MNKVHPVVYVTGNEIKYKVALQALYGSRIVLERESLDTPEIQSRSVEEIAEFSARWACQQLDRPVVVLDAGYYIEALNGFPGPFIKFINEWFSAQDYLNLLQGKTDRRITVRYCLAYCTPGKQPAVFHQVHHGEMAVQAGDRKGTSIDQIFIPAGYSRPVSEIPPDEMISYWSQATIWQELKQYIDSLENPR